MTKISLMTAGLVLTAVCAGAAEIKVKDTAGLRAALNGIKPGTTVLIAAGNYQGGNRLSNVSGTEQERIVIKGEDPANPPVFAGPSECFHFSSCNYITLANLEVRRCAVNGLNMDDGGKLDTPAHHIVIENLRIFETGPKGNANPIKLSGICDFVVRNCRMEGWDGQGIDMVGCHRGVLEGCHLEGRQGFDPDNAVQMKGGTSEILVHRCFFKNCGDRTINLGGATGLQFFRPKVEDFEAKDITVAGNLFIGGWAPIAWASASGGRFHHNTVYLPEKWALRILQENSDPRFKPCHDGVYENNLVVFDKRLGGAEWANAGRGTDPKSFVFRNNAWFEVGGARKPVLPSPEKDGIYGVDPELKDAGTPQMKVGSTDPRLKDVGADAYKPEPARAGGAAKQSGQSSTPRGPAGR